MSDRFTVEPTPLDGLVHLTRAPLGDTRGFLERVFCRKALKAWGGRMIAQINRTRTLNKGTLRGLHFQNAPYAECKYVTCLSGKVFDVALDLRADSPTFKQWFGVELSDAAHNALIIPEGFAHGFQTLTNDVEMLYLHSATYNGEAEGGVNALDAELALGWPLPVAERSARDEALPSLQDFRGLNL